jgi:hypothetical protein
VRWGRTPFCSRRIPSFEQGGHRCVGQGAETNHFAHAEARFALAGIHMGSASRRTCSRYLFGISPGVRTSTGTPSISSRSACIPPRSSRVVSGVGSISRSRSLPSTSFHAEPSRTRGHCWRDGRRLRGGYLRVSTQGFRGAHVSFSPVYSCGAWYPMGKGSQAFRHTQLASLAHTSSASARIWSR